jgi:hypothetical protein
VASVSITVNCGVFSFDFPSEAKKWTRSENGLPDGAVGPHGTKSTNAPLAQKQSDPGTPGYEQRAEVINNPHSRLALRSPNLS